MVTKAVGYGVQNAARANANFPTTHWQGQGLGCGNLDSSPTICPSKRRSQGSLQQAANLN